MQISLEIAKKNLVRNKKLFSNKIFLVHKQTKIFSFAYGASSSPVTFFIFILHDNATDKLNNQKKQATFLMPDAEDQ